MPEFKMKTTKELFPDKAKKLEEQDKKIEFGKMFRLPPDEKKKVCETINEMVKEATRQRAGLIKIKTEGVKNYEGIEEVNGPWEGSSNISTMVTTISADMMHAKLFPMIWNLDTMHFVATEKHDENVAEDNKTLMTWALNKDMEGTQDKVDDILHRLVVDGTIAVKVVWEVYYTYVTRVEPTSVSEKGEIKNKVIYDHIRRERARWIIKDIDYVYPTFNAENEQRADIIEEVYFNLPMLREMKARGQLLPDIDVEDLEKEVDKGFDPGGTIRQRLESSGIESYYARRDSYPVKCYEGQIAYDINHDGVREQCVFLCLADAKNEKGYLAGKPLHTVSRIGKKSWLIRPFLRRPGLIYGKGIPELVRHLHKEMNAIHNQRIDAGNMVIAPFFFYRAGSGMQPETLEIGPGMGIPLDDPQRDVFFPNYNAGRLTVSFQEENIVMDLIEKLTFLTPAMLGRETASRPTARGTLAVIAQGEQKFGLLAARVQRIFSDLITMTRQLYEENMPPDIQKRVLGKDGNPVWGMLSPETIAGQYDAMMEIDLTAGDIAFEKQADQLIYQTFIQDPTVQTNPSFMWEIKAGYLRSLNKKDIEKYIGPKPDMGVNEGDVDDENIMVSQEMNPKISPQDDHVQHMNGHSEFKREMGRSLTPNASRILTEHILEHRLAYSETIQQQALVNQGGGNAGQSQNQGKLNPPQIGLMQGPRIENQNQPQQQVPQGNINAQ